MSEPTAPAPVSVGRFVWHDLMSTDPAGSRAFYGELFGWSFHEEGGGEYTMIALGERRFGGIVKMSPGDGIPNSWIGYILVENVDAATAKATSLGGTVRMPPRDIEGIGRFSVVTDPMGAAFSPLSLREPPPEPVGPPAVHSFAWNQLMTASPERAREFYGALFGWSHETMEMGPAGTYTIFKRGHVHEAGVMQVPPGAPHPPFWLFYVAVEDADRTLERAHALGGRTAAPATDIPVGRLAVLTDPQGATLAILQPRR